MNTLQEKTLMINVIILFYQLRSIIHLILEEEIRYLSQLFFTQPTERDYQLGEFRRYFCKKRNEFTYLEISQSDYDNLVQQSPTINFKMWAPFDIPWTLIGEEKQVYYINRNIVKLTEKNKKFYGLGKYLQEKYLRYYKP